MYLFLVLKADLMDLHFPWKMRNYLATELDQHRDTLFNRKKIIISAVKRWTIKIKLL